MPTPQGLRTVTLRGRYVEPDLLGTPLKGTVTFTPNVAMVVFPVENTLLAGTESVTLDANGEFVIELVCCDTPGQNPTNWTYTVVEKLVGPRSRTYQILLQYTPEIVELADIVPTSVAPTYLPVVGAQGPPGIITSVNGYSSAFVVLSADDVGAVPLAGSATITGSKTFTSSPSVPVPTLDGQAANKGYVDALGTTVVTVAGTQNISGAKTFTTLPLLPASDPTTANQPTRKSYVDAGLALKADAAATTTALNAKANASDVSTALSGKADTSALALKADDNVVFKLTGDQAASGVKTLERLRLSASDDASLTSTLHAIQIGDSASTNLRLDNNEIMVVNNGVANNLHVNSDGGLVTFANNLAVDNSADTVSVRGNLLSNLLTVSRTSSADNVIQAKANSDTQFRFYMRSDGRMGWGPGGSTVPDTLLYRQGAASLRTTGDFEASGTIKSLVTVGTGADAVVPSNFVLLSYDARKTAGVTCISVSLSFQGPSTVSADTVGNIPDLLCLTLPAGWRPAASVPTNWDKSGTSQGSVTIQSDGACMLKSLNPGGTLAINNTVNFGLTFI